MKNKPTDDMLAQSMLGGRDGAPNSDLELAEDQPSQGFFSRLFNHPDTLEYIGQEEGDVIQEDTLFGGRLADFKVGQKIGLITTAIIIGLIVLSVFTINGYQILRYHIFNLYEFMLVPIVDINRAQAGMGTVEVQLATLIESGGTATERIAPLREVEALATRIVGEYNDIYLTTGSPEFTATLEETGNIVLQEQEVEVFAILKPAYDDFLAKLEQYIASIQAGAPNNNLGNASLASLRTAREQLAELIVINDQFAALSNDTAIAAYRRGLTTIGTVLILSLILGILIAYLVGSRMTERINLLALGAERLQDGDFNVRVPVSGGDEIGIVAQTFNDAVSQLREAGERQEIELDRSRNLQESISSFLDVAMDIADGDLTKRGQVSEDVLGNVVDAINVMVEEVSFLLKDVRDAAISVTSGSTEMLESTQTITESTLLQVSEAQKARDEALEVTKAIRQMADNATASAQASTQALQASEQGQVAVQNTLNGMQNIRREVQAISKRIKSLGDRSLEISEIVDTIARISRQTNLLALNAAIEASGAGEAGRRFAIVADEVRKLADDSAVATQRIADLIKNVQAEVQEVIVSVEDGTREVELGYSVATEAGERLKEIGGISQRAADLAQNIAQVTQIQVTGVEEVGGAVTEIATIAERSQESVLQGRQAAENLQQLAEQLSQSLERFRLA